MSQPYPPFSLEQYALTLIPTDLAEPEAHIRKLAEQTRISNPKRFAGNVPCVYYRLPYVPPCEKFHELRRLILLVRENTGLRANFHGIVALEVSEWLGHEKDDYFILLLKYLFDHSDHWHGALVLKNCTESKLQHFMHNLNFTIPGTELFLAPQLFFSDPELLKEYCRISLSKANRVISENGLSHLVETLSQKELAEARSLALIDLTLRRLVSFAPNRKFISEVTVRQYLECPDTALAMMLGTSATGERSIYNHESRLLL